MLVWVSRQASLQNCPPIPPPPVQPSLAETSICPSPLHLHCDNPLFLAVTVVNEAHLCASWDGAWGRWSGRRHGCRSCRSTGAPLCAPAYAPSAASAGWTCVGAGKRSVSCAHAQAVLGIRDILVRIHHQFLAFFIQVNKKCLHLQSGYFLWQS